MMRLGGALTACPLPVELAHIPASAKLVQGKNWRLNELVEDVAGGSEAFAGLSSLRHSELGQINVGPASKAVLPTQGLPSNILFLLP